MSPERRYVPLPPDSAGGGTSRAPPPGRKNGVLWLLFKIGSARSAQQITDGLACGRRDSRRVPFSSRWRARARLPNGLLDSRLGECQASTVRQEQGTMGKSAPSELSIIVHYYDCSFPPWSPWHVFARSGYTIACAFSRPDASSIQDCCHCHLSMALTILHF